MVIILKIILTLLFMFQHVLCEYREDATTTEIDIEAEQDKPIRVTDPRIAEYYRRAYSGNKYCAREPGSLTTCLPKEIPVDEKQNIFMTCGLQNEMHEDCEPYQCVFGNMGTEKDPGPYRQHMNKYIKLNPEMKETVDIALSICMDVELKQQGLMTDCPAYDIYVCMKKVMLKNTPDSLWEPGCTQEREYIIRCTVCPINCRAESHIKPGTCNACADI